MTVVASTGKPYHHKKQCDLWYSYTALPTGTCENEKPGHADKDKEKTDDKGKPRHADKDSKIDEEEKPGYVDKDKTDDK